MNCILFSAFIGVYIESIFCNICPNYFLCYLLYLLPLTWIFQSLFNTEVKQINIWSQTESSRWSWQ